MMSDVIERYRAIFRDAYEFYDIEHKPSIATMLNPKDKFWKEYEEQKNEYAIFITDVVPSRKSRDAFKQVLITDISISIPLMKLIHKAMDAASYSEAEERLFEQVGDLSKYMYPIITYITEGHYTIEDIRTVIRHILYDEIFNSMKQAKDKKADLYSCINFKNRKIRSLQKQLTQLKNKIRYAIDE